MFVGSHGRTGERLRTRSRLDGDSTQGGSRERPITVAGRAPHLGPTAAYLTCFETCITSASAVRSGFRPRPVGRLATARASSPRSPANPTRDIVPEVAGEPDEGPPASASTGASRPGRTSATGASPRRASRASPRRWIRGPHHGAHARGLPRVRVTLVTMLLAQMGIAFDLHVCSWNSFEWAVRRLYFQL